MTAAAETRITKASNATELADDHVSRAAALLESATYNGYGIYNDPLSRRANLVAARRELDAAIAVMAKTTWPTPADYANPEGDADGDH